MMPALFIFFFVNLTPHLAASEVVYLGGATETVDLVPGQPTILRFPAEVRTVSQVSSFEVRPANDQEPDYSVLAITPRIKSGKVSTVFVLADHSVYKLEFRVKNGKAASSTVAYEFRDISELTVGRIDGPGEPIEPLEFMRLLISREYSGDLKHRKVPSKYVSYGPVAVRLAEVIDGPGLTGLIYRVINRSKDRVEIKKESIRLGSPYKPLVSYVTRPSLSPKGKKGSKTLIRVVALARGENRPEEIPFTFFEEVKKKKARKK